MRCPECYLENEAHAKLCAECGADLTQVSLLDSTPHRTNQVWNTDIDGEKNRKNSRTALVLLGVTAALVLALVVAVAVYLPNVLSFSMDSFRLPDINISDFVDELFREEIVISRTEPAPEPDYPPAESLSGADLDFLNVLAAYAIELSYIEDAEQQMEIHGMFYPEFEYMAGREYKFNALYLMAQDTYRVTLLLSDSTIGHVERLYLLNELSTIVWTVEESFGLLSDDPEVLDYYAELQWVTEALIEVEYDLQDQLWGADTVYDRDLDCQLVCYTNNTPYTLDIMFYNDFVTDAMHYSDEYGVGGLMPNTGMGIPLYALEEIGTQDHTWHIGWVVTAVDGISTDRYYE